jgi:hypothetical protein
MGRSASERWFLKARRRGRYGSAGVDLQAVAACLSGDGGVLAAQRQCGEASRTRRSEGIRDGVGDRMLSFEKNS